MVIRRYAVFGSYDRGQKAHREFKALELAQRHGIPVPEPLYLDDTGQLLGTPGIVTRFVPGDLVSAPPDPARRARSLATMLARIHSVPCDAAARTFLLDADAEASWFLRTGSAPDYMRAHPDGVSAWQTIHDLWPNREPAPAGLVHIDYWSGNVLWGAGRIVAVVDWEEAAHGEPGIDVAYCRMDMVLCGLAEAADEFLRAYQAETGRPVPNLGLWELAAGARPMFHGAGWIDQSPSRERFRQFLASAWSSTMATRPWSVSGSARASASTPFFSSQQPKS
jgi:aminoglycoside phosphotransferase (APT) family kinase protein